MICSFVSKKFDLLRDNTLATGHSMKENNISLLLLSYKSKGKHVCPLSPNQELLLLFHCPTQELSPIVLITKSHVVILHWQFPVQVPSWCLFLTDQHLIVNSCLDLVCLSTTPCVTLVTNTALLGVVTNMKGCVYYGALWLTWVLVTNMGGCN